MSVQKLYLAAVCHTAKMKNCDWILDYLEQEKILTLESFWYKDALIKILKETSNMQVFLDSGAYSWHSTLMKKGVEPTEDETKKYFDSYISFILENKNRLDAYANLDVVGDPEKTLANQEYMEKAGLSPVAVFHYSPEQGKIKTKDKHYRFLEKIIQKYNYIALGGGASEGLTGVAYVQKFGDAVFNLISKKPEIKVHGFGIAAISLLIRYPWYSVDATSWAKYAAFGIILMPRYDKDMKKFRYDSVPIKVRTSKRSKFGDVSTPHFTMNYSKEEVLHIRKYFEKNDLNEEELNVSWTARIRANIIYFENLATFLKNQKIEKRNVQKRFF